MVFIGHLLSLRHWGRWRENLLVSKVNFEEVLGYSEEGNEQKKPLPILYFLTFHLELRFLSSLRPVMHFHTTIAEYFIFSML